MLTTLARKLTMPFAGAYERRDRAVHIRHTAFLLERGCRPARHLLNALPILPRDPATSDFAQREAAALQRQEYPEDGRSIHVDARRGSVIRIGHDTPFRAGSPSGRTQHRLRLSLGTYTIARLIRNPRDPCSFPYHRPQ